MRSRARLASAVILSIVTACGSAPAAAPSRAAATPNPRLAEIVAAARAEGELVLSWPDRYLDARAWIGAATETFKRTYGFELRVRSVSANDDVVAAVADERAAGRPASSDVVVGTEGEIVALSRDAALAPELWTTWSKNIGSLKLVAPGGVAVQVQTRIPGITYDSKRIAAADVPRSLADLLKPQLKGRIATTVDGATFERLASPALWGPDRTLEYVRKLAPQIGQFVACGEEERIARGEVDAFAFDCGGSRASRLKAQGTVVGWTIPADGALLRYVYAGVPKHAAHPNAARLWIDLMLGREVQDLMYRYELADHHLVAGSRSFADVDRATKAGVKFYEVTVEGVLADEAAGARSIAPRIRTILRDAVALKK